MQLSLEYSPSEAHNTDTGHVVTRWSRYPVPPAQFHSTRDLPKTNQCFDEKYT
jgi:hypothetical protein